MTANTLNWAEVSINLNELTPFEKNPRVITDDQFAKLKASLVTLGQFRPLLVTHDYRIAGGHQRLKAMRELGWKEVRVSVPSRPITDAEYRQLLLQDNHTNGVWDIDALANDWGMDELRAVGLHEVMNIPPIDELGEDEGDKGKHKVICPECNHVFPVKGNRHQEA